MTMVINKNDFDMPYIQPITSIILFYPLMYSIACTTPFQ